MYPSFGPVSLGAEEVGPLHFRGGLELSFGSGTSGISGLEVDPETATLVGTTDVGDWFHARTVLQDGRLTGLGAISSGKLRGVDGELATVHVTYLEGGRKLTDHQSRKLLSPLGGWVGCAVRLTPPGPVLAVAEGVETEEQADVLRAQGCDEVQGYLYSRPVSAEELIRLLENV